MLTITVLYNNLSHDARLQTDWGFACLVESQDATLLFDTGGKSDILLKNMRALELDPRAVDTVFLSHVHADHTGGLAGFLAENPTVTVILPQSFPESLKATVRQAGATLVEVTGPAAINAWAYTTGELGGQIREQALALETAQGLVVITGCAHPGIVTMVRQAQTQTLAGQAQTQTLAGQAQTQTLASQAQTQTLASQAQTQICQTETQICQVQTQATNNLYLVMGGFHLRDSDAAQIAATIAELQALGVQRIAPSHCTGDAALRAFADAFGPAYHDGGAGQVFTIAAPHP